MNLLGFSIHPDYCISYDLRSIDWKDFYSFVTGQAIVGIVFEGVKRLESQNVKPPFNLLIEWIGLAEHIAWQNKKLNNRCAEVVREYREAGFDCCVLKGQGNAAMYP